MASLQKNVASQKVTFGLVNASTGAALTSATFTSLAWVTVDGTQAGFAGTFTTLGNGQYQYAPTQGETNGTNVGIFIAPSGAVPVNLDFHTDVVDGNGLLQVDVVDIAGSAVATGSAQLGVNVVNIGAHAVSLDGNNLLKVDVADIAGLAAAASNVSIANATIGRGTCTTGGSTTSVATSAFTPNGAAAGQFIGRTMIFDYNTTTSALQGQATTITASTNAAAPTFTVTALTTAPSSGDTFGVY